ncbi:prolipoprotein diacylglyceryl transferase [Streptacidiphilus sp. 4-A2]|nr:prolipoprotein diacylglyceryl transferase [Streptacidiphilus sp. 4-A2]
MYVHFYALMYIVGISIAVMIGRRRWRAVGATRRWSRRWPCGAFRSAFSVAASTST